MKTDSILRIWVDKSNRLCIKPATITFDLIWRSAMGVYWNDEDHFLYSQKMQVWSPVEWFRQILSAVEIEYGYKLHITGKTEWESIDGLLKKQFEIEIKSRQTS